MLRTVKAARLINKAADAFEHHGNAQAADELVSRALTALEGQTSDLAAAHTGRACQLRAEINLSRGEVDSCLHWYVKAESALSSNSRSSVLYVRFLHDAVLTLADAGMDDLAKHYVGKGLAAAVQVAGPYRHDLERLRLELEDCTASTYGRYKPRVSEFIKNSPGSSKNRGLLQKLAEASIRFGDADDVRSAFETLEVLYETSATTELQIASLTPLAYLATRPAGRVPPTLLQAADGLTQRLTGTEPESIRSAAYLVLAVALMSREQPEKALDACLRAVALSDSSAWRVGASVVRLMTGDEAGAIRYVALKLACQLGRAELAAELIETARLPALPDTAAAAAKTSILTSRAAYREVLKHPLRPLHPVTMGGRSSLQAYYPAGLPLGEPLDLEASIRRIGGDDAWWWGAWLGPDGCLAWAVRSPDGTFSSGCDDHGLESPGSQLLQDALKVTPSMSESTIKVAAGEFNRNYSTEEMFSVQLGALLVPEPLRKSLAAVARGESEPITMVAAGNYLSLLPLPLLSPANFTSGQPARLIELATILVAPPVAMVAEIGQARPAELPYPVAVACADPTSELEYARLPAAAENILGGHSVCQAHPRALRATRDNLINALHSVSSPAAVFAFAGHAGTGGAGADLESYLELADGERVDAGDFFSRRDGRPAVPLPERVLLAACGSAGSTGSGRGEWLGLGAGALLSGAQEVVATAWPIWDTAFTQEFDEKVLSLLTDSEDVARDLRRLQLENLAKWRASTADHSNGRLNGRSREPLPLIWASYQFLGVRRV